MFPQAYQYIQHLFTTEKRNRNIEAMMMDYSEKDYHRIHHFISESKWSARVVMDDAAQDVNRMFKSNQLVGLIIDESGEVKKGDDSVGVAHQYCGNVGKLANSQVGVFGCLVSEERSSLIDARLYLPKNWAEDPKRCDKVGIPKEFQVYKKKVNLALDIIARQKKNRIRFDWVGADAFYGNDSDFTSGLDELGLMFVADIHADHSIHLDTFEMEVPVKQAGTRGKPPTIARPTIVSTKANVYKDTLKKEDWQTVTLRNGTKGALICQVHVKQIYTLENNIPKSRVLIIRKTKKAEKEEIKYALSNADLNHYTAQQLVGYQSERYFIEHSFRETRQNVGMFEYQVRGWLAWHHHMALVMQAMGFVLSEKILHAEQMPLLTATDVREMLIDMQAKTSLKNLTLEERIERRHRKRQNDMDRHYQNKQQET